MRSARLVSLAAMLVAVSVTTVHAQQGATTTCKDGTTSTVTGKGACSGHGGVAAKAAAAAKSTEKAVDKTAKQTEKAAEKTGKAVEKTAKKSEKAVEKTAKKAAGAATPAPQVTCVDGTMSKGGRGACSGHGGIKKG